MFARNTTLALCGIHFSATIQDYHITTMLTPKVNDKSCENRLIVTLVGHMMRLSTPKMASIIGCQVVHTLL